MRNIAMSLCISGYHHMAKLADSYQANLYGALAATVRHAGYSPASFFWQKPHILKNSRGTVQTTSTTLST